MDLAETLSTGVLYIYIFVSIHCVTKDVISVGQTGIFLFLSHCIWNGRPFSSST